jgi:hypothetical protein
MIRGAPAYREDFTLMKFAFARRLTITNQIFLRRDSLECC